MKQILFIILLIFCISSASAACRVAMHSLDQEGNLIEANTVGTCYTSQKSLEYKEQSAFLFQFGNPAISCEEECSEMIIESKYYEDGILTKRGALILNNSNVVNWSERETKFVNITLYDIDNPPKKKSGGGGGSTIKPPVNNTNVTVEEPIIPVIEQPEEVVTDVTDVTETKDINIEETSNNNGINLGSLFTYVLIAIMVGGSIFIMYKIWRKND